MISSTVDLAAYSALCEWADTSFLVISANVFDPLIYYSHLVPILLSLPLAVFIFLQAPKRRLNQYFLLTVLLFSAWSFGDLILWAHADPRVIMFVWSLLILLEPLIYITALLFAYTALFKKPLPGYVFVALGALILPTLVLLPTKLAIVSFNLTNCWREVTEGPLVYYGYTIQVIIAAVILAYLLYYLAKTTDAGSEKVRSVLAAIGTLLFLAIFSSGNIFGSWFEDWTLGQYGIFGMPVMVAFLSILIARYRIFNSKILTTDMLVAGLGILTLGIFFIQNLHFVKIISLITFVLVAVMGTILARSVRREVRQREEIEHLAERLERANERLKVLDKMKSEFVSIASHQLRSPLTSIRGYASMLLEGSYGKLTKKAADAIERISNSSRYMALSVEDYLNVSRIESGNMKYNYSEFNLRDEAQKIVADLQPTAKKKKLALTVTSTCKGSCTVSADIGKVRQIIQNIIDNAMKYTPKGRITVTVHNNLRTKKICVSVKDTGVGMSKQTLHDLFEKFVRARNANKINVTGTGLGLFVAKRMAEDMGGRITARSDGEGKGSTFTLELPLTGKNKK